MTELVNKVILVIGAGGLIGQAVVSSLLGAGARVVALDADQARLDALGAAHSGAPLRCQLASIAEADSIADALGRAVDELGRVDGAVNLAYPRNSNYGRHLFDVSYADFSENVSLHLGGYFVVMQQCAKYALDAGVEFSLVQFASIYGVIAPRFEIYADSKMTMPVEYAAIKSGVIHLAQYLTAYTKGSKFRINCVSPGGIFDHQDAEFLKRYKALSRDKGMLDIEDVLGAVLYLCSDASRYVCGQNIVIDDGFSV